MSKSAQEAFENYADNITSALWETEAGDWHSVNSEKLEHSPVNTGAAKSNVVKYFGRNLFLIKFNGLITDC